MEELAVISVMAAAALAVALANFIADLAGLAMGLGWRYYSKKRIAAKEMEKRLDVND